MAFDDPLEEAIMAEQARDPKSPKTETDKKIPETVLLTAEELRAIAGGAGVSSAPPKPVPKVVTTDPHKPYTS
jgi:hypothetical protein